jgi:transposase
VPSDASRVVALGDELARIHDALREDLHRLRTDGRLPERTLAAHCLTFCATLTRHHEAEEDGAFPALAARFPDLRPLLAKMAEDHQLIAGITARVEAIAQQRVEGDARRLIAELDGLGAILESHFAFEERRIRDALDELDGSATELLGS